MGGLVWPHSKNHRYSVANRRKPTVSDLLGTEPETKWKKNINIQDPSTKLQKEKEQRALYLSISLHPRLLKTNHFSFAVLHLHHLFLISSSRDLHTHKTKSPFFSKCTQLSTTSFEREKNKIKPVCPRKASASTTLTFFFFF